MRSLALPSLVVAVLCLAACVPEPPVVEPSSSAPVESESPTPSAVPTSAPEATEYPGVDVTCDALIPAQAMYDFNSNFNLIGEFDPDAGSLSASVADRNGTACRWVNASSNETIDVAIARLPEPALTDLKNETSTASNPVPTYGVEGYFAVVEGMGQAQAFTGDYWIVVESPYFAEPGEVTPLVDAILAAI